MTLDSYLTAKGFTEASFAERIQAHQTTVHRIRKGAVPNKVLMQRIFEETKGAVAARDYYGMTR